MKYFIIAGALSLTSFGINAQKLSEFEKLARLERTRYFPYCRKLDLSQNTPSPIKQNKSSLICYSAIDATFVAIVIYNSSGKIMVTYNVKPGVGEFEIHSSLLAPGKYYYALIVNGRRIFKKQLTVSES